MNNLLIMAMRWKNGVEIWKTAIIRIVSFLQINVFLATAAQPTDIYILSSSALMPCFLWRKHSSIFHFLQFSPVCYVLWVENLRTY